MAFRKSPRPWLVGLSVCGLGAVLILGGCSVFAPIEPPKALPTPGKPDISKLKVGTSCRIETPHEAHNGTLTYRYYEGTVAAVTDKSVTLKDARVGTYPQHETPLAQQVLNPRKFFNTLAGLDGDYRTEVAVSFEEIGSLQIR